MSTRCTNREVRQNSPLRRRSSCDILYETRRQSRKEGDLQRSEREANNLDSPDGHEVLRLWEMGRHSFSLTSETLVRPSLYMGPSKRPR